jgi:N6-L-threonylcarbamoyladenine synthase
MLQAALDEAELLEKLPERATIDPHLCAELQTLLEREPALFEALIEFFETHTLPELDLIAVTSGPGLEPALWVGVNFARALSLLTGINVVPVNHMEGHVLASVYDVERDDMLADIAFPTVALLVSGGHTELILMRDWGQYEKIGQTRDDAVGEAFDKVARLIGLPYPGGPAIGTLAADARARQLPQFAALPRPMANSGDLDFSFSGLKTAVRYAVADKELSDDERAAVARDFEAAAIEVLVKKADAAVQAHNGKTLIVGGGVANNRYLRDQLNAHFLREYPDVPVYFPMSELSTDNSIMIALAGHARAQSAFASLGTSVIRADGNKSL